ncbi:MAG TPA: serine/threonine-protein kinase, partial [Anaeromyxobacteraceae bacterium]|nr:serine/threonine-protein kinase [Anaeromyxobacteraceae bacterium]
MAETKPKPVPAGGSGTVPLGSGATGGAQPPPESYVGRILDGRWRIVALLGSGGMGAVYRAEHVHIGRTAAVKLLHADVARSPAERDRFRREARIAVKLRSPHVVEVVDFGEDADGRLFIVMELLHGESLRARLAREGRLAPERAVRLLRQLLDGLGAAHAAGIV